MTEIESSEITLETKDFEIIREPVQVTRISGNRTDLITKPAAGNLVIIASFDVPAKNKAAMEAKLAEIQALASNYSEKKWVVEAQVNCDPQVNVRVIVRDDVSRE